ncbi:MAG: FtsQ-type POTRA domain-containing protein [Oscillospiraceae bacterium]|nr:FtsQ-type POTRA domain-containing protein [Oscillospiraceae bacterium]
MNSRNSAKVNKKKKAAAAQSPKRVSRRTLRRRLLVKRIIGALLGAVIIGASFYASAKLLFIVKTVNVSGSQIFTAEEITEFMNIPMEESMFRVDTDKLTEDVMAEFRYLEEVRIEKRFPDIIEVTLTDSVESYYTVSDNQYRIYSQNFRYLRNGTEPPLETVWLDLDTENSDKLQKAKNLIELLEKNGVDKVTKISVHDENSLSAEYDNRIVMEFGTELDIEYKIKMCNKIISEKIPDGEYGVINATNSGEAVYTRQ